MTRDEKIIRNKVGVLELAKQLGGLPQYSLPRSVNTRQSGMPCSS